VPAQGLATLAVLAGLLLAMALLAAYSARAMVFNQRTAAQQVRSVVAFETAESGLDWALAQLNAARRIDERCLATADMGASSFRDRALRIDPESMQITPTAAEAACRLDAAGPACRCPAPSAPRPAWPPVPDAAGVHHVAFVATGAPGTLQVRVLGCTQAAAPCAPSSAASAAPADAHAQVDAVVGWLTALPHPPLAALTARGDIDAVDGAVAVNHEPHHGGVTIDAGGRIRADATTPRPPSGSPAAESLIESDAAFHHADGSRLDAQAFFARFFGLRPAAFRALPGVREVDCALGCDLAMLRAIVEREGASALWLEGPVRLDGPGALGSRDEPVLVVARGPVGLRGGAELNGLLYVAAEPWRLDAGSGTVRGAVVAQGDVQARGPWAALHDEPILQRLAARVGVFARVPGGWRDIAP
jgi:hypothetical protein